MKTLMHKTWFRLLMMLLYCVCVAVGVCVLKMYEFARNDGWYTINGEMSFTRSVLCLSYVDDCLQYVEDNLLWLKDPTMESLSSYGGKAFSYRIVETDSGAVTADTLTERSHYVIRRSDVLLSPPATVRVEEDPADAQVMTVTGNTEEVANRTISYDIEGYVNLPVEPYDGCYLEYAIFEQQYPLRQFLMPALLLCTALAVATLLFTILAGVQVGREGTVTPEGHIPADVVLLLLPVLLFLEELLAQGIGRQVDKFMLYGTLSTMGISVPTTLQQIALLCFPALAAAVVSNQIASRSLRRQLLTVRILHAIPGRFLLPLFLLLHFLVLLLLSAFSVTFHIGKTLLILLLGVDIFLAPCLATALREEEKVEKAAGDLAAGDLAVKVDTARLHRPWNTLGEHLNQIGDGMTLAVEEKMRSERMKTELITNVSHDLKTPLTSILSYIALLKNETLPEETRREYLDVLERQGAKLKKLTEDVIEASKAASGAIRVQPEPLDMRELLEQSVGEYSDRLQAVPLEAILHMPDHGVLITADPRLLGRVLDNFLTNIHKYALPDTRVYFDLSEEEGWAVMAVKNISKAPLDIPAEALMERFVQGDRSRNTEGSGLGLSIARSLTELMGGQMALTLDGDLFKVEITFPIATGSAES